MEVRIYQIDKNSLQKVKTVLEKKDTFDIEIDCKSCGKKEVITVAADRYKEFFGDDNKGPKIVKCSCGGNGTPTGIKGKFTNEFALNGYILRDGGSLGFNKDLTYLYIKAEENFFKSNEKEILTNGVKIASGSEHDKVKTEIEKEQEAAAEGISGIFNI